MSVASQVVVLSWAMIAAQAAGPLGAVMVLPMSCARLIAVLLQHHVVPIRCQARRSALPEL